MLEAAGIRPTPPEGGWQWYGRTPVLREISQEVKSKYNHRGFYFDNDLALFAEVVKSERR
ncbi:MAG: hypothetical protein LBC94_09275, partial [Desulfovibrio sp.]|jgi:hypothetical protein|nr:hypothetical protein [Desulfovibrio sp.]